MSAVVVLSASAIVAVTLSTAPRPAAAAARKAATAGGGHPASFTSLDDSALWHELKVSGGRAVVGLKAPKQAEGVQDGQIVIDPDSWSRAKEVVRAQHGVTVLAADDVRPNVTVAFENPAAMSRVRRLPHVEFVEPNSLRQELLAPGAGCTGNAYDGDPEGGDVYSGTPRSVYPYDKYPSNFDHSKVVEAWVRGRGDGVTVGVVDTGVFSTQEQLQSPQFSAYMSSGRTVRHLNATSSTNIWDTCNHGTRMASTITAPRDGKNMVGVAWRANLVSVKAGNDVLVDSVETGDVARAIRMAADNNARIIAMAFGTGSWEYQNIKQEIQYQHNRGVLFVGAAGTSYCLEGVVFPAKMPEVVAVTGVTASGALHPDACGGPEVDAAAVIDDTFASGRRSSDLITMGGSSGATAVAAGVAALIWSSHPEFSRDQVRDRLIASGSRCCATGIGSGIIDAYKAVGGFAGLSVSGPSYLDAGSSYTLTARPEGDGPFTYQWSTGETTQSINRTTATDTSGSQTFTVSVTDTREGKTMSRSHTVWWEPAERDPIEPPCTNPRFC